MYNQNIYFERSKEDAQRCPCNNCRLRKTCVVECDIFNNYVEERHFKSKEDE